MLPGRARAGLAEDVRHYGKWMRDEAEKRIGHLYPKIEVTEEMVHERPDLEQYAGRKLTVIAWLWARTVKSPNPAFGTVDVPLASTFVLSSKKGKEAYVEPVIEDGGYRFTVKVGTLPPAAKNGTKIARGSFRCLLSDIPFRYEYIDDEANAGRMGERMMAVVAEGNRGRVYLPPTQCMESVAYSAQPTWRPDTPSRGTWASNAQGRRYGFQTFGDYFTNRQLVALTTFCDLVTEARERIRQDMIAAGVPDDAVPLRNGGLGTTGYADAVGIYLALAVGRTANSCSSLSRWQNSGDFVAGVFARQAIPMLWDYADTNVFSTSTQNWMAQVNWVTEAIETFPTNQRSGYAFQDDAASPSVQPYGSQQGQRQCSELLISTDPPYYDNVGYADLSDFFYVWLRRSLRPVLPELFATLAVPKAEELVATPYRHGNKEKAEIFFLDGMTRAMHHLAERAHPTMPVSIYYAFKQSERGEHGFESTGWETFLDAAVRAGFAITGTWPVRTERGGRVLAIGTNALASSIVLICRPRSTDAPVATRREFIEALKSELPDALRQMQQGNIAPVDLAQAAIGPGMAIFTRYARVLGRQR